MEGRSERLPANTRFWGSRVRGRLVLISQRFPQLEQSQVCEGVGSVLSPSSNRHLQGYWNSTLPASGLSREAWSGSGRLLPSADSLARRAHGSRLSEGATPQALVVKRTAGGSRLFLLRAAPRSAAPEVRLSPSGYSLLPSCPQDVRCASVRKPPPALSLRRHVPNRSDIVGKLLELHTSLLSTPSFPQLLQT